MSIFQFKIFKDSIHYKIVFLIWALIDTLTVGQKITKYFSTVLIIWGVILIIQNIINNTRKINRVTLVAIIIFLTVYTVTIVINRENNLIANIKTLIWQSIMMLVLFVIEEYKSKADIINDVLKICRIVVKVSFIFSIVSILLFLLNIKYIDTRVDGVNIYQGYHYARLWGIYVDPNQASVVAQVSIMTSIILLIYRKEKKYKLVIFNIIVQYIYIVLAASRGGEISFIIVLFLIGYLFIDYKFILNKITLSIISLVVALLIILSASPTRALLVIIPEVSTKVRNEISENTKFNITNANENIIVDRRDLDSSNGRITLWKDGLRLIRFSPIIGFGDRNIPIKAAEYTPGSTLENKTVHNGFIHLVMSGGVIALISMGILVFSAVKKSIRILLRSRMKNKDFYIINSTSVIIGILLCTSIFLTEIFYKNSFSSTAFWIFLGFNMYLSNEYLRFSK